MIRKLLLLFLLLPSSILAKILIITHSYNRPDFIQLQAKTFEAFLEDDYEYVVFNDAPNHNLYQQIEATCKQLNIRHIQIPQHIHTNQSAGHRHIDGIHYSFNQIGYNHDDIVALIDSDMFLIKPFNIRQYLDSYLIAAQPQSRGNTHIKINYVSPALVFINMKSIPNKHSLNFTGGYINGFACDVGGHMYYYFKNNPSVTPLLIPMVHIGAWKVGINCHQCKQMTCKNCIDKLINRKFNHHQIQFIQATHDDIEFYINNAFLHYRSGSNWNHKPNSYHLNKTKLLNQLIDNSIKNIRDKNARFSADT